MTSAKFRVYLDDDPAKVIDARFDRLKVWRSCKSPEASLYVTVILVYVSFVR